MGFEDRTRREDGLWWILLPTPPKQDLPIVRPFDLVTTVPVVKTNLPSLVLSKKSLFMEEFFLYKSQY
ncbi:hypothetical protein CH366_19070 [Leptospira harrisiae]|uniref:Uncharacterized protein n=1 Tax=Leptospira harrisiae TaxID=2023189 RepID=A0A2N0AFQ2_9LEPT|nr:hypothetical protein CH364_18460 [Leptospira harrisiae]PKA06436.1 hypothetical protein CH366_19070 [Leptospira harrisiae]